MNPTIVEVPGGQCVMADLFDPACELPSRVAVAILDPPYGDRIVKDEWDDIGGRALAAQLRALMNRLASRVLLRGHVWLWGGIGTPGHRALYRTLLEVEDDGAWQCAEQVTWEKKRGYGTKWRCLMNREECLRFVLGDAKHPRVYHPQFTTELRGYAGFNKKYPAKSEFKRLTMTWKHASDMLQNKPHKCHKPSPLAHSQILATTDPGDLVLDLFAASGEVSLTARRLGRPFVAYESDPKEFKKLVERLK